MKKLIKRTYRITEDHDKLVKKHSKKIGSESEVIRQAIDKIVIPKRNV